MTQAQLLLDQGISPTYLETIGQALYQALLPVGSSLRTVFNDALHQATEPGEPLHLRLRIAPEVAQRSRLADYPWELLHDGQRFLSLHRQLVVSRYLAYEARPPAVDRHTSLKVLLVSSTAGDPALRLPPLPSLEPQAIRDGLANAANISLDQLPQATRRALRTYDGQPQVVHFDGHGLYGQRCVNPDCQRMHNSLSLSQCKSCDQPLPEPEGFLLLADDQGRPDYVSAQEFALLLPSSVVLVVLSACQSAMAMVGTSLFRGVAQRLIDTRVPAVVAMQYSVLADAASQFAEQFYRELAKGKSLVATLQSARRAMVDIPNQWYRPALYLRWRDDDGGQLFKDVEQAAEPIGLRRSQRLDLKRLKEVLEDLAEDYGAIRARLRTELDPVTERKLKRKLKQISDEMDSCEQEMSELQRRDG